MNNCSVDDVIVQEEVDDLNYGIAAENEGGKATWAECFSKRNVLWKRTMSEKSFHHDPTLNNLTY